MITELRTSHCYLNETEEARPSQVLVKARAGDASIALQNKTGKGVKCGLHGLGWQGCELSYLAKAEDAEGLFNVVDLHLP